MGKEERIAVYEDTKRRCKKNLRLREAIEKTNRGQEILLQGTEFQEKHMRMISSISQIILLGGL